MATEKTKYIDLADAVIIHLRLMKRFAETRYGVDHLELIESAWARPRQAAFYENADTIRQAATLYFGLIKIIRGSAETNARQLFWLTNFFISTNLR